MGLRMIYTTKVLRLLVLVIFYGSQSGTAIDYSYRTLLTARQRKWHCLMFDANALYDYNEIKKMKNVPVHVVLFIVSTYGDGGPPYNAERLNKWLREKNNLEGVFYAVVGLGNDGYQHYNSFGKLVDHRLNEFSAKRAFPLGLCNAAGNQEYDFTTWKAGFIIEVLEKHGKIPEGPLENQYVLKMLNPLAKDLKLYQGEPSPGSCFARQKGPYNITNPYLADVICIQELHSPTSSRSCLRIGFNISGSRMHWIAGDHIGIYPENHYSDVLKLSKLLKLQLQAPINFVNKDPNELLFQHRFPSPCTLETALIFYVDINRPPSMDLLRELSFYAEDSEEASQLEKLSQSDNDLYRSCILVGHHTIVSVLEAFPSCHPPIELLLEMVPRMQPRFYSISSSPKVNKSNIYITVVKVEHPVQVTIHMRDNMPNTRLFKGVCSTYLSHFKNCKLLVKKINVPVFARAGRITLPKNPQTPIIMIGAGTGLAPFIGFLQDRQKDKEFGVSIGNAVLFFGCRSVKEDFIYRSFLEQMRNNHVLTELYVAFSRDQTEKSYVQHLIEARTEKIWDLIEHQSAWVYVAGDARRMAGDVRSAIGKIGVNFGHYSSPDEYIESLKSQGRYQEDTWTSLYEHTT